MKYRIGKIKYDLYAKDKDAKTSLREFYQRDTGGYYSRSYNMSKLRTLRPYCFAYRILGGTVNIPEKIEEIPEGAFYHAYFGRNFSTNSLVLTHSMCSISFLIFISSFSTFNFLYSLT